MQVSGLGNGAGCERLWRSLQEKAGLVLTLEKAVPRPGMGEGGAPDRQRSKEGERATEDCLRQLEISRRGRAKDVAVGDVVREGRQRAWGRGQGYPRRPWGENRILQGELAESLGKMLGLSGGWSSEVIRGGLYWYFPLPAGHPGCLSLWLRPHSQPYGQPCPLGSHASSRVVRGSANSCGSNRGGWTHHCFPG